MKVCNTAIDGGKRFFLDTRGGCAAVRDRLHPDYDKTYNGLHSYTPDVVEYKHGFQNHEKDCWDMLPEDIEYLRELCDSLNDNPPPELEYRRYNNVVSVCDSIQPQVEKAVTLVSYEENPELAELLSGLLEKLKGAKS